MDRLPRSGETEQPRALALGAATSERALKGRQNTILFRALGSANQGLEVDPRRLNELFRPPFQGEFILAGPRAKALGCSV